MSRSDGVETNSVSHVNKAIRDLQVIAENLNRTSKFCATILLREADNKQIMRTYNELVECKDFVMSLIKVYRNTPDSL